MKPAVYEECERDETWEHHEGPMFTPQDEVLWNDLSHSVLVRSLQPITWLSGELCHALMVLATTTCMLISLFKVN